MITNCLEDNNLNLANFDDSGHFAGYASVFNVVDYTGSSSPKATESCINSAL